MHGGRKFAGDQANLAKKLEKLAGYCPVVTVTVSRPRGPAERGLNPIAAFTPPEFPYPRGDGGSISAAVNAMSGNASIVSVSLPVTHITLP